MDETTARSELLGRMPELHRLFRERINEIDYETFWNLEIDFLVLAIWMFGDRELVVDYFKKFKGSRFAIREDNNDVWSTEDLSIAILSVNEDAWLECIESVADNVSQSLSDVEGLSFKLIFRCERTLQLVNVVLDRVKDIRGVKVDVFGFDPSPAITEKLIQVLDRSSPLDYLWLNGITDRCDFWSEILKYAFHKPPIKLLGLEESRDYRLVTSLAAMRGTTTLVPRVSLRNCIIDDELFSLLLAMPISRLSFQASNRIRGDFSTVADALASNTTLKELGFDCEEGCSSFTEALLNGVENNVTLEGLDMWSLSVEPFSSLCRAVGRNGSIRRADLPVSSPMDEACMHELAQSPSLQDLTLRVDNYGSGSFSWSAMSSFLRVKRSLKRLKVSGCSEWKDPSVDDLCMIGQSLADNTSLEILDLDIWSYLHRQTWKAYAEFVSRVGCNTTLRSLTFVACPNPDTIPSGMAFDHAMECNYGLEDVRFTSGDSTPIMVETICKLNAAGRKYMLVDSTSRMKGVDVLSRVINNLDCLFYHLRENPSLCILNEHRNDIAASPSKSRKRRRCPQSTNAEQCVAGMPCERIALTKRVGMFRTDDARPC